MAEGQQGAVVTVAVQPVWVAVLSVLVVEVALDVGLHLSGLLQAGSDIVCNGTT